MKASERVAFYIREIEQIQASRGKPGGRNFVNRKILADAAVGELQGAIARIESDPEAWERSQQDRRSDCDCRGDCSCHASPEREAACLNDDRSGCGTLLASITS